MSKHRNVCLYMVCEHCGNNEMEIDYSELTAYCPCCNGKWALEWGSFFEAYVIDFENCLEEPCNDDNSDMPECCIACGGPYPNCMTSCKLFDD